MGFSLGGVGRVLKRTARSTIGKAATAVGRAALNTATGGLSEKALSVGKSIGAKVQGNRLAKRQGKAVTAALMKLEKAPAPGYVQTPSGRSESGWVTEALSGELSDGRSTPSPKRKRGSSASKKATKRSASSTAGSKRSSPPKRKTPAKKKIPPSDAVRESKKVARKQEADRKRSNPIRKLSKAAQEKFAKKAEQLAAKGAKWSKMSDAAKKEAGGWRKFAFGG